MKEFHLYNEPELLKRIAESDEKAFRALFDAYKDRFYAVALKMTGCETVAQEMVQELFIKIWENRSTLTYINNIEAYLFTALYRKVFRYFKRKSAEYKYLQLLGQSTDVSNNTTDVLQYKESEQLINEAIAKLPPQQQMVFRMNKQDGLSRQEIAQKLRLSPNTVRNHLTAATQFVRTYLKNADMVAFFLFLTEF